MPWTVHRDPKGCSEAKPWSVVKLNDGQIVGCHATEKDADDHVAALYAGEGDDQYNSDEGGPVTAAEDLETEAEEIEAEVEEEIETEEVPSEEIDEEPVSEKVETETETEDDETEEETEEEAEGSELELTRDRGSAEARLAAVPAAFFSITRSARADHRNLPPEVLGRLSETGHDVGVVDRVGRGLFEMRFRPEMRMNLDGSVFLHGYATVYDHPYEVLGGPPHGWVETMTRGSCSLSVQQGADVRLLINHDGIALARTRSGTMQLESDEIGLYTVAPNLDMRSPTVQDLVYAMQRGDMDEMSFAFKVLQQDWNGDYTERQIKEVKLYDVSVVTYPANPATKVSLRTEPPSSAGSGFPAYLEAESDLLGMRHRA